MKLNDVVLETHAVGVDVDAELTNLIGAVEQDLEAGLLSKKEAEGLLSHIDFMQERLEKIALAVKPLPKPPRYAMAAE